MKATSHRNRPRQTDRRYRPLVSTAWRRQPPVRQLATTHARCNRIAMARSAKKYGLFRASEVLRIEPAHWDF